MTKNQLIQKATLPLVALGVLLASYAYIPILRFALGLDESISMAFSTTLVFLIGGYMAGLAGLIAWAKAIDSKIIKVPSSAQDKDMEESKNKSNDKETKEYLLKPHLLGLLLVLPTPFISCIALLIFWQKDRHKSEELDQHYRGTINFHLSLHLYFLLCFFLAPLGVGIMALLIFMLIFLLATLWHLFVTSKVRYPANINIIPANNRTE
jgi:uncharacterized Tic20 family protein